MIEIYTLLYVISVIVTILMINDEVEIESEHFKWEEFRILIVVAFTPILNLILMRVVYISRLKDDN